MAKKRRKKPKGTQQTTRRDSPTSTSGESERDGTKGGQAPKSSAWEWIKSFAVALVLFLIIRTFVANTFVIISSSMENTLLVGDLLLVNRAAIGSQIPGTTMRIPGYSRPERGDVLVFDPHHEVDMKLVKRLMGLPGDTLEMRSKRLSRNGEALDEPYVQYFDESGNPGSSDMQWQLDYLAPGVDKESYGPRRDDWGPIVVPEGHYFMLGDNRDLSLDSRYWGPLAAWRIEGRVILTYFSYNKDSNRPFPFLREIRWGRIGDLVR